MINKKIEKKFLPVGIAMGVLFSASPLANPLTENKVYADVDTAGTILTTFGNIYDAFLREPFVNFLDEQSARNAYKGDLENRAYKAPSFTNGEFGISVYDYHKNKDFSKKVKLAYPNGTFEYKTIKHGEQLRIKQAGTMVDLTPDEPNLSKHDILYITQKQLDEGKTGVALTNWQTFYLKSAPNKRNFPLGLKFMQQKWGVKNINPGNFSFDFDKLFDNLPHEHQVLATITSEPVGKEVISNYVTNDSEALADFKKREIDLIAETKLILDTPIELGLSGFLNGGNSWNIIPYKKGTNKVFLKTDSKYLSGKEGNRLEYSDSIGDDELFELVQIGNSYDGKLQFRVNNKNGVSLAGNMYISQFGTDWSFRSEISFPNKSNNEINNWLKEWYPGKDIGMKDSIAPTGDTYQLVSALNNSSVVDLNQPDGNVHLWQNGSGNNQKWKLEYDSNKKAYQIKNIANESLVLAWNDYRGSNNVFATPNHQYAEHYWIVENTGSGYFYLRNKKNPNKVLDVTGSGTGNGTNIIVWDFNGSNNQKFKLQKLN
ncbi:ricin-type beta-trefoil lectin domain protein [Bacillus thuringiensis]|nr:ricin-type beta-trefoil lectin domain protein [Bacillus thuringiensis]